MFASPFQPETAQQSPTGLQTCLCPDPEQAPPPRINPSIRPLLTNPDSLGHTLAATAFGRNENHALGCNNVTHKNVDANCSNENNQRRIIHGHNAGDKETSARFASNTHCTPLSTIVERTSSHASSRSCHTVSIGVSGTYPLTCIDLSFADGLDTHALNTEEFATQEFREILRDSLPPERHPSFPVKTLSDDVYTCCQNYPSAIDAPVNMMIFGGETRKVQHCESSKSENTGKQLNGVKLARCASSSSGPGVALTLPKKDKKTQLLTAPLRSFTSSLSASCKFARFHRSLHGLSNRETLAGSGRPSTARPSHHLKAPRISHQQFQGQLKISKVISNYCNDESCIQPATDQMFGYYSSPDPPAALTMSVGLRPLTFDHPERSKHPVDGIISNENSFQAAQLPQRTEQSEHAVPCIKGIGATHSSRDDFTSRYTDDVVPIYDPIESSFRNYNRVLSSNENIYNDLHSESPNYRHPTSSPRFHSRSCQELEIPQALPLKSRSSSPTGSTRLFTTRGAGQATTKIVTSAALPILLQIAAAEGIATKFNLTPRHTSGPTYPTMQSCGVNLMAANAAGWHMRHGECRCQHRRPADTRRLDISITRDPFRDFALTTGNFGGFGPSSAKALKEQQQKQSSTHNKGCRSGGKSWKCMIGDATNRIVDDVVLHCFC